ncbi:MAG: 50S ribosomal protein L32 [Dehalococcoidia bacterium]
MALPKKKTAKARQGKRRSHLKLTLPATDVCPHCHSPKLSHHVCPSCGWYNAREAIEVKPAKK